MKTADRKRAPQLVAIDVLRIAEDISRKTLERLQREHGLRVYQVDNTLMVDRNELDVALNAAKKEVQL